MQRETARYSLRIDRELLRKLVYTAQYSGRSVNAELIILVRRSVREFEKTNGQISLEPATAQTAGAESRYKLLNPCLYG